MKEELKEQRKKKIKEKKTRINFLEQVKKQFLDFLFPPFCIFCKKNGPWLCEICSQGIITSSPETWTCILCEKRKSSFAICSSCQEYEPLQGILILQHFNKKLQKIIHHLKYKYIEDLAPLISKLLIKKIEKGSYFIELLQQKNTLLVPIPLHKKRLNQRGFNQSELIAKSLQETFSQTLVDCKLQRTYETQQQMSLNRWDRFANLEHVFEYAGMSLENKHVILVDDVSTTGATLLSSAHTLKYYNPLSIHAIVLAHGFPVQE